MSELHHATHARCTAHRHSSLIVWFIDDETLGGEEHACDGCSILQSHACHLCRVDDTSLAEVLIFACAIRRVFRWSYGVNPVYCFKERRK